MIPFLIIIILKCGKVACRHFYFGEGYRQHRCHEFVNWKYIIPVNSPVNVFLPVKENTLYAILVFDG
jgi:hypothetical protein